MYLWLDYSLANLSWAQLGFVPDCDFRSSLPHTHVTLFWDQKATQSNGKSEREQAQLHWNI